DSIHLWIYGMTDKPLIRLLEQKASHGVSVHIAYDPSASSSLYKKIPHAHFFPHASKGLMHKKIFCIDDHLLFLGSANFTLSSLRHHDNLVIGIDHPALATFIQNPQDTAFAFTIQEQPAAFYLLPDRNKKGLLRLLELIDQAHHSIRIAMFTFTHPQIAKALIQAKKRGLDVTVAVDYYTAKGASKKTVEALHREGVTVLLSQGTELLHYKWGWIDEDTLAMGSANWTTAAFTKNDDFILVLSSLNKKQNLFLRRLWKTIEIESTLML
ncbi:MAG: phosphatidylserine/phosphatidylglycerophosphate/cardiolipin synthase family protein, partial [Chlamydiota bacterium]